LNLLQFILRYLSGTIHSTKNVVHHLLIGADKNLSVDNAEMMWYFLTTSNDIMQSKSPNHRIIDQTLRLLLLHLVRTVNNKKKLQYNKDFCIFDRISRRMNYFNRINFRDIKFRKFKNFISLFIYLVIYFRDLKEFQRKKNLKCK